jgi:transposase
VLQAICYLLARPKVFRPEREWPGGYFTHGTHAPLQGRHNNAAERALRPVVVGRKNFYGSASEWSGELAAMMFSLLMTVKRRQINPRTWLNGHLHACAVAGSCALPDLKPYLPWTMSPSRLQQMRRAPCENPRARPVQMVVTS